MPGVHVINPGSVSNPLALDLRASYAVIQADRAGYTLVHRRVTYDLQAVLNAVVRREAPVGRHRRRDLLPGMVDPHVSVAERWT